MPSIAVMYEEYEIDVELLVTEDAAPISLFAGKQQRLLTETLYSSWEGPGDGRKFFAAANIGVFYMVKQLRWFLTFCSVLMSKRTKTFGRRNIAPISCGNSAKFQMS